MCLHWASLLDDTIKVCRQPGFLPSAAAQSPSPFHSAHGENMRGIARISCIEERMSWGRGEFVHSTKLLA